MAHINICLNHIKNAGYTKHFTDEEARLSSFQIISSEEMVKLDLLTKQNKKLEKTVTYATIEDLVTLVILGNEKKIDSRLDISPNVDLIRSKQKTNTVIETPNIKTEKMEAHNSNILKNTEKVNVIMFKVIQELDELEPTSLYVNRAKAMAQASQVILNSAKVEMDYLKRFGK